MLDVFVVELEFVFVSVGLVGRDVEDVFGCGCIVGAVGWGPELPIVG